MYIDIYLYIYIFACLQLGQSAVEEECYEEGIALLHNALAGTRERVLY